MHIQIALVLFTISLVAGVPNIVTTNDPDLPGFVAPMENISSCSFLIPMDGYYQSGNDDAPPTGGFDDFNIATYGLIIRLLWDDIPVVWSIKSGKKHDDPDIVNAMTVQVAPNSPSNTNPVARNFSGGPFIIETIYTERAWITIKNFSDTYNITVFKLTEYTQVPVRYRLIDRPYVAVFDSSKYNYILREALEAAGLENQTHFRIMSKNEANTIGSSACLTIAMEPHFHCTGDPAQDSMTFTPGTSYCQSFQSAMRQFIDSGGNFIAMCGGIMTYEQCDGADGLELRGATNIDSFRNYYRTYGYSRDKPVNTSMPCPDGFIFTNDGINSFQTELTDAKTLRNLSGPKGNFSNQAPDVPYTQYTGNWAFNDWSSVESMSLWHPSLDRASGITYKIPVSNLVNKPTTLNSNNGAYWSIAEGSAARDIIGGDYGLFYAGHAKLQKSHNGKGGNFFILAGHDYQLGTGQGTQCDTLTGECPSCNNDKGCWTRPGRRLLLNAILTPANRSGCSINVTTCTNGTCVIENKGFVVDPCKWGACKPQKRDLQANTVSPILLCACNTYLDLCGICGGDNSTCVVNLPPPVSEVPSEDIPPGLVPDGVDTVFQGTIIPRPDPTQPPSSTTPQPYTIEEILAILSASDPTAPQGPGNGTSNVIVWPSNYPGGSTVSGITSETSSQTAKITLSPPVSTLNQNAMEDALKNTIATHFGISPSTVFIQVSGSVATVSFNLAQTPTPTPTPIEAVDITLKPERTETISTVWKYYYITVGVNVQDIKFYASILSSNPNSNLTIYFKKLSLPTLGSYDCAVTGSNIVFSYINSVNRKLCTGHVLNGEWFIGIPPTSSFTYNFEVFLEPKPRADSVPVSTNTASHQHVGVMFIVSVVLLVVVVSVF